MSFQIENSWNDKALVNNILQGDRQAFKKLIQQTEQLVVQIIFKMVPGKEDRKDLIQDVYLKVFDNLRHFRFQSRLSTWIARIAYNTSINYLNKRQLRLVEIDDEYLNEKTGTTEEPLNLLFQKQLSEILEQQLDKLSPLYRTLITLYHNESLSYQEIAEITALPMGTVKNYLHRARTALANNLITHYKKEVL